MTDPSGPTAGSMARRALVLRSPLVVDGCFAAFCVLVATSRYLALTAPSVLPGIDGGNWLALGHAWLGGSGPGTTYPPLVPVLTVVAVSLFGPIHGVAGLAALSSVAPAAGAYGVLRSQRLGWVAAMLSGFLLVGRPTGEATAWGGYPQLLGIGVSLLALAALDRYLASGTGRHALATGVLLALDLATSHFTGLMTVAAGVVIVLLHLLWGDRRGTRQLSWRTAWLVLAPSLVLVPVYWRLVPALVQEVPGPGPALGTTASIGASGAFAFIGVAAVLATPLVLWRRQRSRSLWRLTTSVVVVTAVAYGVTREPRLLYFGPIGAILAAALWIQDLGHRTADWLRGAAVVASLILTVALGVQTVNSFRLFHAQRDFYSIAPEGMLAATDWLRGSTSPHAVLAVAPVGGAPLGWWVEGLTRRPTDAGSDSVWLAYPQERARARIADSIFTGSFPDDATIATAMRLGVDYLVLPTTWNGYDAGVVHAFERAHPSTVKFDDGSVVVLSTGVRP